MRLLSVIVTYHPDVKRLVDVLTILSGKVDSVFVVDNGSSFSDESNVLLASFPNVSLISLFENTGIAFALNVGIQRARELNATHILLMDQDSLPRSDMISLMSAHLEVFKGEEPVAAIGPRFIDVNNGAISQHVHFEALRIGRIPCPEKTPYVPTDFLITSGSLIPLHVLDDVGPMDETLFIDHVDTEWCLRAKSKGYELLGDCEALMEHDLGEYRKRIWFFRWREVPVHKAFRYYYIFRNSVLLYRRKYIPWSWIRIDLIRLIQIFGFTLLFGPDRLGKIAMMFRGVRDAFLGKTGKLGSKG